MTTAGSPIRLALVIAAAILFGVAAYPGNTYSGTLTNLGLALFAVSHLF